MIYGEASEASFDRSEFANDEPFDSDEDSEEEVHTTIFPGVHTATLSSYTAMLSSHTGMLPCCFVYWYAW